MQIFPMLICRNPEKQVKTHNSKTKQEALLHLKMVGNGRGLLDISKFLIEAICKTQNLGFFLYMHADALCNARFKENRM